MAPTSSTRIAPHRRSCPWSNTSKSDATNSSASRSQHLLWKTSSSNSRGGGYAIEKLRRTHAHARPACFSQQDVLFLHPRHAFRLFLSVCRCFRQERAKNRRLLSRPRPRSQRHGQFLGTERDARHVPRARNPSPLSRSSRDCQRHARVERRG